MDLGYTLKYQVVKPYDVSSLLKWFRKIIITYVYQNIKID